MERIFDETDKLNCENNLLSYMNNKLPGEAKNILKDY